MTNSSSTRNIFSDNIIPDSLIDCPWSASSDNDRKNSIVIIQSVSIRVKILLVAHKKFTLIKVESVISKNLKKNIFMDTLRMRTSKFVHFTSILNKKSSSGRTLMIIGVLV